MKSEKTCVISIGWAVFCGLCGGLVASLFVFGLNEFSPEVLAQGHPLLSAPFLTFVGVLIIVAVFYTPLRKLLSKGHIKIKWGNGEINLEDIEKSVDAEFEQYESKLSDLSAETQEIRDILESKQNLEKRGGSSDGSILHNEASVIRKIRDNFAWVNSDKLASLVYHLATSKYRWRNQSTLMRKTGMGADEIDEFVRAYPEYIIRSQGKSGNIIYRLSNKAKAQYLDAIQFSASK